MAKIYVVAKYTIWVVMNFLISPIAEVMQQTIPQAPPEFLFYFFTMSLFVPEVLMISSLISSKNREWIKSGIEDGDGKLNLSDMVDFIVKVLRPLGLIYSSIWMGRIFALSYFLKQFYGVETDFKFTVLPFLGSMGTAGLALARAYIKK